MQRLCYTTALLFAVFGLAGCLPVVKVIPAQPGAITAVCHSCIAQNVGLAPLNIALFAEQPDGADAYLWDLGDGSVASGRFVSHTYSAPGQYIVTMTAQKRKNGKRSEYVAQTAFIVLEPPRVPVVAQHFENELLSLDIVAPRWLDIRQVGSIEYIIVTKRPLVYVDLRSAPSAHLFAEHDGYFQRVLVPAGVTLIFSYEISGFTSGLGHVQVTLKASDGKVGAELNEITHIYVGP